MGDNWVSVKDKLPDDMQKVLATGYNWNDPKDGRHYVACEFFGGVWMGDNDEEFKYITHWMPLPEPPKE